MATLTKTDTARYLAQRDCFAILTHRNPDGDTLGSAAALCRGLRQLGKTAHILENPQVTEKYAWLVAGLTKPCAQPTDTLVCVDVAAKNMLPDAFSPLADRLELRIDHHKTSLSFTAHAWVDPQAAACGQLIYDLLAEMGVRLDVPMANALYTAISTDTGCFRYANTQSETLAVAAVCARISPDLAALNQQLFETNSLARLKLQGWIAQNALFLAEGQLCVCAIPREVEQQLGVTEDDMENISGFPRSIAGVKMAATLRQEENGRVKLSVRAMPGYDAAAVCARFGGGGHPGAAGAGMSMPLEDAVNAVIAAFPPME